ncbi:MAG TPA: hypothetical protein VGR47_01705 [Terracidiphilus sp.]|nr:hypothetical protein [Terracidiphilus sp.]
MSAKTSFYANQLRQELAARNRAYAGGLPHVESYGSAPVIVYAPEGGRHGNFFDPAYAAITARPDWMRRFNKVHAQAARSLPKADRRWRELDSCTSSDALLMNVFCTPGVLLSPALQRALGLDQNVIPVFGWKARVPLLNGRFDRTEVDLRLGSLLIEAKLTEGDFQTCKPSAVEQYRDFETVFDRSLLPQVELPPQRRKESTEFPEHYSQEFESLIIDPEQDPRQLSPDVISQLAISNQSSVNKTDTISLGYASYQLIRNVLAAHAEQCSFCVIHDQRRPDLREEWFHIIAAVKSAEFRTRLKVLTWQELAAFLPADLQAFLDRKYGIVAPGRTSTPIDEQTHSE